MRIVIPSSSADTARLPLLVDVMLKLGHLRGHDIMLVPTARVRNQAEEQAERLRTICPTVTVEAMESDPPYGWFVAPNMQFSFAFMRLHQLGYRGAIFWNEIDCVPVKPGWADDLEKAWFAHGKPFCGCVVDTPFRTPDGRITTEDGDRMMMGCGIYPNGLPTDDLIKPLFTDLAKLPPYAADQPWDVYLRWVLNRRGVAHTELIGDMWNTQNYRMENGNMVCDAAPSRFTGRARGGVVSPQNVVVHGCKDESLYRLVLGEVGPTGPHSTLGELGAVGPAGEVGPIGHYDPAGPFGPETPSTITVNSFEAEIHEEPSAPTHPAMPDLDSTPPIVVLEKHLVKVGKTRINDAARDTGLTQQQVREVLPLIGYVTKGPGWIVKKETRGRKAKV